MLSIVRHNQFKKDYKRALKRGKKLVNLLPVITALTQGKVLAEKFRAHRLVGNYNGYWECHIEPDYLMIYYTTNDALHLIRLGTHSDLF